MDTAELIERVSVSDSLVEAKSCSDGWKTYRDEALIPGPQWRGLTGPDLISAFPIRVAGDFIGLVRLSPSAVCALRSLLPEVKEGPSPARDQCIDVIKDELHPSFVQTGEAIFAGLTRRPPALQTGTVDSVTGLRTGLHLDSWEGNGMLGRHTARNRIAVNLGRKPRRLIFMATSVELLLDHLRHPLTEGRPIDDELLEATAGLARTAYALTIMPGEAYIAPTECLVHDASTTEGDVADISLAVRMPIMPASSEYD